MKILLVCKSTFSEIVSKTYIPILLSIDKRTLVIAISALQEKIMNYIKSIETRTGFIYYISDMNGNGQSAEWLERSFTSTESFIDIIANIETIIYTYCEKNNLLDLP